MPSLLTRRSFKVQWLVLGAALMLLAGVTGTRLFQERQRIEGREESRLATQAQVIEKNLGQNFASIGLTLADLRKELPVLLKEDRLSRRLEMLADAMPGVRTLIVTDRRGVVIASGRPELMGKDFSYRDYFRIPRQHADLDAMFVSAPFRTTLGPYVVVLSRIVRGEKGEFSGIVAATLDPAYFSTLISSVIYAQRMETSIIHGDGLPFLTYPAQDLSQGGGYSGRFVVFPSFGER